MSVQQKNRVLLIGWDAADWRVITPLIEAGKMPNLERLINTGVKGNLMTLQPVLSPMLWSSIATGKRPYKHGVHGFSEPDPVSGGIRPVTNLSRKTKAFWNIANQNELNSIVVGWWPSHPVEPLSRGVMVSNNYQRSTGNSFEEWSLPPESVHPTRLRKILKEIRLHPTDLTQEMLTTFLPAMQQMDQAELDKLRENPRLKSMMKIIADCSTIHSAATALIQNEPWDVAAIYYDAIDHFGHGFMKFHPPKRELISEEDFNIWKDVIESGYRLHDMMLGTLMQLAGEETTIILMSDHGFHPDHMRLSAIPNEPAGPAAEHRQLGILVARGPGLRKDELIYSASVLDICPTILHRLELPIGEDMDGRVLYDLWEEPQDVETIPTWEKVEGDDGQHAPGRQIAPADSKAALDQLVALGYIDQPAEDRQQALDQTVRELDYNLACAYIDGGIFTEAIVILERLYARWQAEHRFGVKLTVCYQALKRTADLREVTSKIIERRLEEAKTAADKIKELKLDDPEVRKSENERISALPEKEREKVNRERQKLFSQAQPNLYSLRYLEAFADFAEKKFAAALEKLEQLDEDFGSRRNALSLRGDIYLRMRDWDKAKESYNSALEIDSEVSGPYLGLARAELGQRNFDQAISLVRKSIGITYGQPRAHYLLGMAHFRKGNYDAAERSFMTTAQQAPLMARAYRLLSEVALKKGDIVSSTTYREIAQDARKKLKETIEGQKQAASESASASTPNTNFAPLLPRSEALKDVPESDIVTIVSGLPRSGTSLMMQMLDAAGISVFTDHERKADESNPEGYYEAAAVGSLLKKDQPPVWLSAARGSAVKVVAPLLSSLPVRLRSDENGELKQPVHLKYRVLFMEREMNEILDSQQKMLERLERTSGKQSADIARAYQQQTAAARSWMSRHGIPAMSVNYNELVQNPVSTVREIANFLKRSERIDKMMAVIKPDLYRSRSDPAPSAAE